MVECYEQQLEVLALANRSSPAGLRLSTAAHAASVGEERFKKGDCRGASRLLRYEHGIRKLPRRERGGHMSPDIARSLRVPEAARCWCM